MMLEVLISLILFATVMLGVGILVLKSHSYQEDIAHQTQQIFYEGKSPFPSHPKQP